MSTHFNFDKLLNIFIYLIFSKLFKFIVITSVLDN